MKHRSAVRLFLAGLGLAVLIVGTGPAVAQGVCPPDFCDDPDDAVCDAGGFRVTLTDFIPAAAQNSGMATYVYEICSPAAGTCVSAVRPGESCLDNDFCRTMGQNTDPNAFCTRECAVDSFRDLSHFDVVLPPLVGSCLTPNTQIGLRCTDGVPVVGPDGSCGSVFSAKCDNTDLAPGECLTMTVDVAGELNRPGLGSAIVVSKESRDCNETCILGPACDDDICDRELPNGEDCLTRTRGFWSTHPHLIRSDDPRSLDLLPIMVCGEALTTIDAGGCESTSEALCTNALDMRSNPTYLALVAQLTAAKLNLAATAALSDGTCSGWMHDGMGIQDWIAYCETSYCDATKQAISRSGCIEALDDFNRSTDTGFDMTPAPFDRPGPALVDECRKARGNGIVIGRKDCA